MLTFYLDTFANLTMVNPPNQQYILTEKGIAWPGEHKKYSSRPDYNLDEIVPPPNWAVRFPNGYNDTNIPDLAGDEHFQNWMRTAGLPTFSKLYARNDNDVLLAGTYQISVGMRAYRPSPRPAVWVC